jgi:hypothetical protein
MAMYGFVSPLCVCGVLSCVFVKLECVVGEESLQNAVLLNVRQTASQGIKCVVDL